MGIFVRDDTYDETKRMTGFQRYKQLLSFFAGHWTKLNIITFIASIPLIAGIIYALLSTSLYLMIPFSIIGGAIVGPFWAALVDSLQRGLRDDPTNRWLNYKKALRQNFTCSLLPGGITGLIIGIYSFYIMLIWNRRIPLDAFHIIVLILSVTLVCIFEKLYWIQLVLFKLSFFGKMRNTLWFVFHYPLKTLLGTLFAYIFGGIIVLFSPYFLLIIPFIGYWFPLFISQFLIYDALNKELHIEELFS